MQTPVIRATAPEDLADIKQLVDATKLFPSELLDEMSADYFNGTADQQFWITYYDESPLAVACYAPEMMASGTWNLYLICVHPNAQGKGIGAALMRHVENELRARGARILLVETSGLDEFELTRKFYRALGYVIEATVRDFYEPGDDKVIFYKTL